MVVQATTCSNRTTEGITPTIRRPYRWQLGWRHQNAAIATATSLLPSEAPHTGQHAHQGQQGGVAGPVVSSDRQPLNVGAAGGGSQQALLRGGCNAPWRQYDGKCCLALAYNAAPQLAHACSVLPAVVGMASGARQQAGQQRSRSWSGGGMGQLLQRAEAQAPFSRRQVKQDALRYLSSQLQAAGSHSLYTAWWTGIPSRGDGSGGTNWIR